VFRLRGEAGEPTAPQAQPLVSQFVCHVNEKTGNVRVESKDEVEPSSVPMTESDAHGTVERYNPDVDSPDISCEHWHRYLHSLQYASGKVVLDIACGEGYGSRLLASRAKWVVGVDVCAEAACGASKKYV